MNVQRASTEARLRLHLRGSARSFFVSVNGAPAIEVAVTGTSWDAPVSTSVTVTLDAGSNTIKLFNDTAFAPDLDRIIITAL